MKATCYSLFSTIVQRYSNKFENNSFLKNVGIFLFLIDYINWYFI